MNIIVCGDSHSNVFNYSNEFQDIYNFKNVQVRGATAFGIINPHSSTDALKIFSDEIHDNYKNSDKLMIMLGEVDCGFLIWIRSSKHDMTIEYQLERCIENLFIFAKNQAKYFENKDIIIVGAILPTIKNNNSLNCSQEEINEYNDKQSDLTLKNNSSPKFLNGLREKVTASQIERTELTLNYNKRLKEICEIEGYQYVDITKHIINENNIVCDDYLRENIYDHHLCDEKTYEFWIEELNNILM
jgi:hypothetical protein